MANELVESQAATASYSIDADAIHLDAKTMVVSGHTFNLDETTYNAIKAFLDAQLPTVPNYVSHNVDPWA